MILGKSILGYSTLETILVYLVSETRKMFRQNRTPKKSNQLWELVLTPREAIIVRRPFWPPINNGGLRVHHLQRRLASVQLLRDSPIRLSRGRTQVFASSNESFG